MKYEIKLRLNERQYFAVLDKGLVIVTEDENGKPIRYAIFGDKKGGVSKNDKQSGIYEGCI